MGFQQAAVRIEREQEFEELRGALQRALGPEKVEGFLKQVQSQGIRVRDFEHNRVQRRIVRRNEHVHAIETQPLATGEQYALFSRYVMARHHDGDMADMDFDDYRAMVEESPVETAIIEFRDDSADGRLVGACLVDWLSSGVSAVYSYFDPQNPRRGLGTYMILWLADAAARRGLPYVYLGYWIADSSKMAYKRAFRPLEFFGPEGWTELPTA